VRRRRLTSCSVFSLGVNSLPETVTRQRRDCNLNSGPSAPESSTLTTQLPSHLAWINDKSNSSKKSAYTRARGTAHRRLRHMQNEWWAKKAQDLQQAADRRDMKAFYHGLRAVYGPRDSGSVAYLYALMTVLPSVITDRQGILSRWTEHFHSVLNQTSTSDPSVLNLIPNWAVNMDLIQPSNVDDVRRSTAVNQMASGKAPGLDSLPTLTVLPAANQIVVTNHLIGSTCCSQL